MADELHFVKAVYGLFKYENGHLMGVSDEETGRVHIYTNYNLAVASARVLSKQETGTFIVDAVFPEKVVGKVAVVAGGDVYYTFRRESVEKGSHFGEGLVGTTPAAEELLKLSRERNKGAEEKPAEGE